MKVDISNIIIAIVSAISGAVVTYLTTTNNIELEQLKLNSEIKRIQISAQIERCKEIKNINQELSLGKQTWLYDKKEFDDTILDIARLRSLSTIAVTYFGREALEKYVEYGQDVQEGEEIKNMFIPSLMGLHVELQACNKPNSIVYKNL